MVAWYLFSSLATASSHLLQDLSIVGHAQEASEAYCKMSHPTENLKKPWRNTDTDFFFKPNLRENQWFS